MDKHYSARALSLRLGKRRVIDGVSLELRRGEVTALIGPNGAGKSTLLRLLSGFLNADSGEQNIEGKPLTEWSTAALSRRRADQFQNVRPHDGVSARQHQHGGPQLRQLVNQAQGFLMGQFIRMGPRLGHGAAMLARQRAGARHFPENQKGAFIEICFTKNRSHSSGQSL